MKQLRFISILLLVLFCLSSCSGGSGAGTPTEPNTPPESSEPAESSSADTAEEETTGEVTTAEEPFDMEYWKSAIRKLPLDLDPQDPPSYETLCKIELGMRIDMVYKLVGAPQKEHIGVGRTGPGELTRAMEGYLYISSEGKPTWLSFGRIVGKPYWYVTNIAWEDSIIHSYYYEVEPEITDSTTASEAETEPRDHYFDYSQTHKPTDAEAESITVGMTYKEVVDRIGKPHGTGTSDPTCVRYWYTQEGNCLVIRFKGNRDSTLQGLEKDGLADEVVLYIIPPPPPPSSSDSQTLSVPPYWYW